MQNYARLLSHREYDPEKLIAYGFQPQQDGYVYCSAFFDQAFLAEIIIQSDGTVQETVRDAITKEKYMPLYQTRHQGAYVSKVRESYLNLFADIAAHCFKPMVDAKDHIAQFVQSHYQDQLEFPWQNDIENGVVRHHENKKWYLAILHVSYERLGLDGQEKIDVLNVKCPKQKIKQLQTQTGYCPAYHMNKQNWITILLDGSVSWEEIYSHIEESYNLTK